jgi:hypothetical protein
MALTNFELYEELKKDLSERSARMIAEIVPAAADLTTKTDFAALRSDFSALEARFAEVEARIERRFALLERRVTLMFVVPLWSAVAAGIVKLYIG